MRHGERRRKTDDATSDHNGIYLLHIPWLVVGGLWLVGAGRSWFLAGVHLGN
jgi:hypothetical protein